MQRRDLSRVTARIAQSKNIQNETFKNAFKINQKSHKSEKSIFDLFKLITYKNTKLKIEDFQTFVR